MSKLSRYRIYADKGLSKRDDRSIIPVSSWTTLYLATYICKIYGYVIEHAENDYLKHEKAMHKLRIG